MQSSPTFTSNVGPDRFCTAMEDGEKRGLAAFVPPAGMATAATRMSAATGRRSAVRNGLRRATATAATLVSATAEIAVGHRLRLPGEAAASTEVAAWCGLRLSCETTASAEMRLSCETLAAEMPTRGGLRLSGETTAEVTTRCVVPWRIEGAALHCWRRRVVVCKGVAISLRRRLPIDPGGRVVPMARRMRTRKCGVGSGRRRVAHSVVGMLRRHTLERVGTSYRAHLMRLLHLTCRRVPSEGIGSIRRMVACDPRIAFRTGHVGSDIRSAIRAGDIPTVLHSKRFACRLHRVRNGRITIERRTGSIQAADIGRARSGRGAIERHARSIGKPGLSRQIRCTDAGTSKRICLPYCEAAAEVGSGFRDTRIERGPIQRTRRHGGRDRQSVKTASRRQ